MLSSDRFSSVIRADFRKGISQYELNPPAGLTEIGSEFTLQRAHQPLQKKSPSGVSTEGLSSPSQKIRSTRRRHCWGATVFQICWMAPGPSISARVTVVFAGTWIEGDTFHPCPSSRAATAPVPSRAIPALPFSPVKFSALIERVFAFDNRERLPRLMFSPLNAAIASLLDRPPLALSRGSCARLQHGGDAPLSSPASFSFSGPSPSLQSECRPAFRGDMDLSGGTGAS